jgi:hypothetical protein
MLFLFWLVLPQTQGATRLYIEYVEPYIANHEAQIDQVIDDAHKNARALGSQYIRRLVAAIRSMLLGQEVQQEQPATESTPAASASSPSASGSYADMLFSRFRLPTSQGGYSLGSVLTGIASTPLSAVKHLTFPAGTHSKEERIEYLNAQRAKLLALVSSLDERKRDIEQRDDLKPVSSGLSSGPPPDSRLPKMPSELDFDVVNRDEATTTTTTTTTPDKSPGGQASGHKSERGWLFWGSHGDSSPPAKN